MRADRRSLPRNRSHRRTSSQNLPVFIHERHPLFAKQVRGDPHTLDQGSFNGYKTCSARRTPFLEDGPGYPEQFCHFCRCLSSLQKASRHVSSFAIHNPGVTGHDRRPVTADKVRRIPRCGKASHLFRADGDGDDSWNPGDLWAVFRLSVVSARNPEKAGAHEDRARQVSKRGLTRHKESSFPRSLMKTFLPTTSSLPCAKS